jgi:hypothetical protein
MGRDGIVRSRKRFCMDRQWNRHRSELGWLWVGMEAMWSEEDRRGSQT